MKALIAENLLLKHQLLLTTPSRKRKPKFLPLDRFLLGLWTILLDPRRIERAACSIRPQTEMGCPNVSAPIMTLRFGSTSGKRI